MNKPFKTTCPSCGKVDTWNLDNNFRPFCSSRCKLIDLGEWASEQKKISTPLDDSYKDDEINLAKKDKT